MLKLLGLAGLLVSVACGGSSSSSSGGSSGATTGSGSCTTISGGTLASCTDYGAGFTASTVMQICSAMTMTTYSADSCPSTNRVGRCEITEARNGVTVGDAVNLYPPVTTTEASSICAMGNGMDGVTTTFVPN